ncbi:MAG: NTP transferase domain-containing protein, partial [Clostridia bacterium]|nr:NTP transferase domain-containing protein [Clostridia bacterium]
MKCLILAAGYATRLYPLTENFPKPLLKVGEKTILDWLVDDINASGKVDEYVVISNHKFARHFEEWAKTKPQKITVADDGTETNETRLGAVKDIDFAIDSLGLSGDYLVIAGDNVLDFSLTEFIDYCEKKKASCVMRYDEPSEKKLLKCGVLTVDSDDRVTEMTEKSPHPATHWCCPPFYYYTREDAGKIKQAMAA